MLSLEPGGFAEAPGGALVHFIDLDLHAEALHTEVDDPVVLIHGLGCSWHHWSRQIGWIAHSRRVVAVDVRGGGGKTRWTRPGWTTADMAADIHAVVTELGLRHPAIVGCSMGGPSPSNTRSTIPETSAVSSSSLRSLACQNRWPRPATTSWPLSSPTPFARSPRIEWGRRSPRAPIRT